jgi:hypothetical protein
MPSVSPPYTLVPLEDLGTRDPETIKLRLLRFLLEPIAFTYLQSRPQ